MAVDTTCAKLKCSWADIVKGEQKATSVLNANASEFLPLSCNFSQETGSTQELSADVTSTCDSQAIAWNVCAEEFVPTPSAPVSTSMRAQAAEFIPSPATSAFGYDSDLHPLVDYGQTTEGWQNLAVRLGNAMTIFEDEVDADTCPYSYNGAACKGDFLALNLALLSDDESDADSTSDVQEALLEDISEQDHSALGSPEGIVVFDELRHAGDKAINAGVQSDGDTCVSEDGHSSLNEKDKDIEWCSDFDPHGLSVDDAFSVAAASDWETDTTTSVKPPPGLSLPPWMMPSRSAVQSDAVSLVSASESEADVVNSVGPKPMSHHDACCKFPLGVPPWRRKATHATTPSSVFSPPPGLELPASTPEMA